VIRVFDFVFSLFGLLVGFPVLLVLAIIGLFDTGSPIFRQVRVGRHQQPFTLVKFRTMKLDTVSVAKRATQTNSTSVNTCMARFCRRGSRTSCKRSFSTNVNTGKTSTQATLMRVNNANGIAPNCELR